MRLGHGTSSPLHIPYLFNDNMAVLIIHTYGWIGGILLFTVFGLLLATLFRLAGQVQHRVGRGIMYLGVTFMYTSARIEFQRTQRNDK